MTVYRCGRSVPHGRPVRRGRPEAPLVLTTEPPRPLRFIDQLAMWANLGISLFGPLTGALIADHRRLGRAGDRGHRRRLRPRRRCCSARRPCSASPPAHRRWCRSAGCSAAADRCCRRCSTSRQNIGWATMEIIVISTAAVAVVGEAWRWPFVIWRRRRGDRDGGPAARQRPAAAQGDGLAGARRVGVPVRRGADAAARRRSRRTAVLGFWPAVDLAVAGVVSFAPLAADYSRHSRTRAAAFWGASLGYGLAAIAYYALGVFAVANLGATDVITALVTLPAGGIALAHPARRRGGRGVRQRLLDHHVGAEPAAPPGPAGRRGDHRRDRDPAGRPAGLRSVPVVPVPDRLGLRAAVRGGRGGLLRWSAASAGTSQPGPDPRWRRWSPGPAASSPTSWSIPVPCQAGRTSGPGWTRRSASPRRAGWAPRSPRSASAGW